MAAGAGRVQPVTIVSPMHRLWALWLRLTWPLADRSGLVKRPLLKLSFINFAHWSVIDRVPSGAGRAGVRLAHPFLLFQSNFNDDVDAYIDAFSLVVPWRMRAMWQGVFGFRGPRPVDRFLGYVIANVTPTHYYYCAYPNGSSRIVCDALELRVRYESLRDDAAGLDDREFAARWERFLDDAQRLL